MVEEHLYSGWINQWVSNDLSSSKVMAIFFIQEMSIYICICKCFFTELYYYYSSCFYWINIVHFCRMKIKKRWRKYLRWREDMTEISKKGKTRIHKREYWTKWFSGILKTTRYFYFIIKCIKKLVYYIYKLCTHQNENKHFIRI